MATRRRRTLAVCSVAARRLPMVPSFREGIDPEGCTVADAAPPIRGRYEMPWISRSELGAPAGRAREKELWPSCPDSRARAVR